MNYGSNACECVCCRYLYASKVDSLIDFDGSKEGSDEAKPLPQLLDHQNFKKVVERNKLNDTVVTNEEIDGSFRTADDIKAHNEWEEYRKMTAPNPMQVCTHLSPKLFNMIA